MNNHYNLELVRELRAAKEQVFDCWTKAEHIIGWMSPKDMTTPNASVDLNVGGKFEITMKDDVEYCATGQYLAIKKNEHFKATWFWKTNEEAFRNVSFISIDLSEDQDGISTLILRHEGLIDQDSVEKHTKGWAACLDKLETYLRL